MYEIATKAVNRFLLRNPELGFLRDDLISASHVVIAEQLSKGVTEEKPIYNAVNSAIRDVVTHDLQGVTRYHYKKHGPNKHVTYNEMFGTPSEPVDDVLREWLECCSDEFQEMVLRLSCAGGTVPQIAAELGRTESEVRKALEVVHERYLED